MCTSILNNPNNKILQGILENKIILILEIIMILYYCVIAFLTNLNLAFYICPYFLFAVFLYILFYLGDIAIYSQNESVHFITIFIFVLPIWIVVFNLWIKNTIIISKGSTLKIDENLHLRIEEIEKAIKEKEKEENNFSNCNKNNSMQSNSLVENDFAYIFNDMHGEIYRKYSKTQLLLIKQSLFMLEKNNFKFSFRKLIKFLLRSNVKSLVNKF